MTKNIPVFKWSYITSAKFVHFMHVLFQMLQSRDSHSSHYCQAKKDMELLLCLKKAIVYPQPAVTIIAS